MDLWPQYSKLDLKILNHGIVVIQDKKLLWNRNQVIILIAKLAPFDSMTLQEYFEFQKLIK